MLEHVTFSTSNIRPHEQFDAYRNFVRTAAEVTPDHSTAAGFIVNANVWTLGGMAFLHSELPGAEGRRFISKNRKEPADHWYIALVGEPNGRNHLQFRSLARDFRVPNESTRYLGLYFARDLFPNLWQAFDNLPEYPDGGGPFGLLADYLVSLKNNLPLVRKADAPVVADMTRALLASIVSNTHGNMSEAEPAITYLVKEKARRYINRNLGSAALTPKNICRAIGVSRTKLYRTFDKSGGVSSFIRRARLMKAFDEISIVSENMETITSIADRIGFPDLATFSRAFRTEFGVTPRDVRNAAIKGIKLFPLYPS